MTSRFQKRLDAVLKAGLTPLLRARGFRKKSTLYLAEHSEVVWIVDVQKSRWNDKDEAQFTVNGGVYIAGVVSGYSRRPDPVVPKLVDCCVSVRIGMLDESRLDKWWKITVSDDPGEDEAIAADVCHRVEFQLLPFLERFESAGAVAEFLERPMDRTSGFVAPQSSVQRHAYASLIYSKLGNRAKARELIEYAIGEAEGTPIEDVVKRVGAEL